MIDIHINFPTDVIQAHLESLSFDITKAIDGAVKDAAFLIKAYAQTHIQSGSRTGVAYQVAGKTSVRSAPGEWPKTDTGRLVSSIKTDFPNFLTAVVGSDVVYSEYLEMGTRNMAPRPWLQRSFDENADKITKIFENALSQVLK